jgi:hypothetical protein
MTPEGKKVIALWGKWNSFLDSVKCDEEGSPLPGAETVRLWEVRAPGGALANAGLSNHWGPGRCGRGRRLWSHAEQWPAGVRLHPADTGVGAVPRSACRSRRATSTASRTGRAS